MRGKNYFFIILLLVVVVASYFAYETFFAPRTLQVSVLDVGEGKTVGKVILARTPEGKTVLIDTGPDASILRTLGKELLPWQRSIDTVVLTGAMPSVAGGLPEVLSRYHVSNLVRFGPQGSKSMETRLSAAIEAEAELKQVNPTENQRISLGDDTYITVATSEGAPANVYLSKGEGSTQLK